MIRITTLLWVMLLVVAGGTVMHVSYQVRHVEKHLAEIVRETRQEKDAIRILSAEWDTLNDPKRIDSLAKRYLNLETTPIQRIVAIEAVPLKPSPEQLLRMASASADKSGKPKSGSKAPVPVAVTSPARPVLAAQVSAPSAGPDAIGLILARAERRE